MAFDKISYNNDFNRGAYDKLTIMLPKGRKADLKKFADAQGVSMTRLVIDALESHCKLDLSKAAGG